MWWRYILSIPKSIRVNFRKLPFRQAVRLPILVYRTKLQSLKGQIVINSDELKMGLVKIGFGTTQVTDIQCERTVLNIRGRMVFNGKCKFGSGSRIHVGKNGMASFGKNFNATSHFKLVCNNEITFGDDNLFSWNCLLMDTDQHRILDKDTNEVLNADKPIKIGNHVWCGCNATFVKGSQVADNVVIGSNSLVTGEHTENYVAIAGNPASIVKKNIIWEE